MQLSSRGLNHLARLEGVRLKAYKDVAGYWTIGVGHLLTPRELETGAIEIAGETYAWRDGLTEELVYRLLDQDADWAERAVTNAVTVPLGQHQFDALVSFVFNVGPGAFRRSTLLRRLNAGDYAAVPGQLALWVNAGGRRIRGLVNRRQAEIFLWEGAAA